jgi:hypothetical protein
MLFHGVVSSQTEMALELFLERKRAEAFIAEVEPGRAGDGGAAAGRGGRVRLQTRLVIANGTFDGYGERS